MPDRLALRTACLAVLALTALQAAAQAQTRYVTDQFEINLRTGTSDAHAILRLLPTGTPLEVLESDAASGYTRVRTGRGIEGWVLSRYLVDEPPARDRLEALQARAQAAESQAREHGAALEALAVARDEALGRVGGLEQENARLERELNDVRQASANVLAIDERNRALTQRVGEIEAELAAARSDNERLAGRANRDWFVAGAGVVGFGVLLGLLLPRLRLRRKSTWRD
jgi:SH3 domain protein